MPFRISIIYRDTAVRASVRFLLETRSWKVQEYVTPGEFAALGDHAATECLVIGDDDPRFDLLRFAQTLRRNGFAAPVVLTTGRVSRAFRRNAESLGVVLVDPIIGEPLMAAVRTALGDRCCREK